MSVKPTSSNQRTVLRSLHPFPARMAPEIAFEALAAYPKGSLVFDPMCGSGTVLQQALLHGHKAIGFDTDPLAVLISRVSAQSGGHEKLVDQARAVAHQAKSLRRQSIQLPWIDGDEETLGFTDFWFGKEQLHDLRALAYVLKDRRGRMADALRLAISKTIITKEPRASLARDTSHSRPHRVTLASKYDVLHGFVRAAEGITREMARVPIEGSTIIRRRDARKPPVTITQQADIVVTSPPYGNAIDYLRGHRLALVWFGFTIPQLRELRRASIGSGGRHQITYPKDIRELALELGPIEHIESATRQRLYRFAEDMLLVLHQIARALKERGTAVLVVGNSTIKGNYLDNTSLILAAAVRAGLREVTRYSREIPATHRYLPPPTSATTPTLAKRMKEEVVITFRKMP